MQNTFRDAVNSGFGTSAGHATAATPDRAGLVAPIHALVLISALLAWSLAARGQPAANQSGAAPAIEIGQTLPDVTMRGLNGPARKLSAFRGRPLVINVWASWCGPCRQEMPSLERLAWQDHRVGFDVIGISTDDDPEQAGRFLELSNATINHYIDRDLQLEMMLGASRLPLTVLVDGDGRVIHKIYGARQWDSPEAVDFIQRAFEK